MGSETEWTDMRDRDPKLLSPVELAQPLIRRLRRDLFGSSPVFVAIDGRSGAGKSTLSAAVADALSDTDSSDSTVTVIEGDRFYAGGSAQTWDRRLPAERADQVIDWRRQRRLLTQLRSGGAGWWRPFDWDADDWDSDDVPLRNDPIQSVVAPVVILEGAYSARPELHDLLDVRVLLDVPTELRRRQLLERKGERYCTDWEARWSDAEDHYFGSVMRRERFDLILGDGDQFMA